MSRRTVTSERFLPRPRDERGMTLTEITVALSLLGIVLAGIFAVYEVGTQATTSVMGRLDSADNVRAVDGIAREIRQATPPADGLSPIITSQPSEIAFYLDADRDKVLERVRYWVQDRSVMRGVTEPATGSNPPTYAASSERATPVIQSLAPGWSGPIFTYYDNADPPDVLRASQVSSVSAVNVDVKAQGKDTRVLRPDVTDLSTFVKIRLVFNNLD